MEHKLSTATPQALPACRERFGAHPSDQAQSGNQGERVFATASTDSQFRQILDDASVRLGASLADVALACFVILLYRHTRQSTIVVATQDFQAPSDMATDCGTSLPLHPLQFEFDEKATLRQVLDGIVSARSRVGQVTSTVANESGIAAFSFARGNFAKAAEHLNVAQDLSFRVCDSGTELLLGMNFNSRAFRREQVQELLSQLQLLAVQAVDSPSLEVTRYSLVTNLGRTILPDPTCQLEKPDYPLLTETFLAIADQSPDAVAIRHDGQEWRYAELTRAALGLSRHLCARGVGEGDVIALTGARGFAIVSSILGIFMSGGVLLTLDPKLPLQRQKAMLAQARAKFLICLDQYPSLTDSGAEIIQVDPVQGCVVGALPADGLPPALPRLNPWAPAYIFFTSGSTGIPKAVLGCHAGLAHFLDWQRGTFGINRDDRAAQITTLSFDMILRDIFLALTTGATLCIPNEGDTLDPMAILTWMQSERITILHIVPTLLRAWVNNAPPEVQLPDLRLVFLAGEPLTDVLIHGFRERFGETALLTNFYGPTETTLIKCYHPVREVEPGAQPAGRPQPQTQVMVFNQHRQLCGLGEPGEIAIRTPFRTLGYLNSAEATAVAFIPNPFRDDPDDLVYLTGDNGRYRTDGLLEVLGRIDNQVKIRGVRVEPGEIEVVLGRHPQVKEAAVVAHTDAAGTKYLAGYVVLREGKDGVQQSQLLHEIRNFLRARLPENMVPGELVALEAMPLLLNGKINRKALAPPEHAAAEATACVPTGGDAPVSPQEAELLEVWKSVLGHSRVTVNDSFVELGGDSLSAITALVRMQRLGIPDSVARGIFQGWSIRQIVSRTSGNKAVADTVQFVPKTRVNLLVNVIRGVLVAILVSSHWFEGLLNRLPAGLNGVHEFLLPVFNIGTPGFALVFGLGIGYIFYPRFATDPAQVSRSLRIGFLFVATGILVRAASDIAVILAEGGRLNATEFFNTFYSALLYYALALLTVPLWFRLIARGASPYLRTALMVVGAYVTYRVAAWLLLGREQEGFFQLCRLMLVGKFNYFNMSVGALSGVGAGIYLARWSADKRALHELAPLLVGAGCILTAIGVALTFMDTGTWAGIKDTASMPLSRWIFYAGTILLFASFMSLVLTHYEDIPATIRQVINVAGVLGQVSLPVFVLHQLVLRVKFLLVLAGVPGSLALAIPLLAFLAACWWMMSKLYRLYHAAV